MRAYFTSDHHIGDGRLADDSLAVADAARNKGPIGVLREFAWHVQATGARWFVDGDFYELYACSESRIWKAHRYVLRDVMEAVEKIIPGNHDAKIRLPERFRYKLAPEAGLLIELDGQRVWLEHGHSFGGIDWQHPIWKLGSRAAYWAESVLWPGLDEWALEQYRKWENARRRERNRVGKVPGCVKCSQELPLASYARQLFSKRPELEVVVFGHTHEAGICQMHGLDPDTLTSYHDLYANCGTWTRNPAGEQRLDVLCYDSSDGWSVKQATEVI